MTVILSVYIEQVEEDADLEIIRAQLEQAMRQAMPFNDIAVAVEDCE